MSAAIIAFIAAAIVSILSINIMEDAALYLILLPGIVGTVVGVGAAQSRKIDELKEQISGERKEFAELITLRDMGILTNSQLEETIKIFQEKNAENEKQEQDQKLAAVLNELKEAGYFTQEQYDDKIFSLRNLTADESENKEPFI